MGTLNPFSTNPSVPTQRSLLQPLRWLMGFVILAAMAYTVDLQLFVATLRSLNPWIFGWAIVVAVASRALRAWKWNGLLRAGGIQISLLRTLQLSLASHFTGSWTPGQLGADAYRVLALRPFGKTPMVVSSLLIERYVGLCCVCLFALIGLPVTLPFLYRESPLVLMVVVAASIGLTTLLPFCLSRPLLRVVSGIAPSLRETPWGAKLRRWHDSLMDFGQYKLTLAAFSVGTMIEVASYFYVNYLCARALGLQVSWPFFFFAMPIVHLMLRIPISVQALGIQESCFAYALVVHGFTSAEGLAVSAVQRVLEWIVAIAPGGLLLWLTTTPFDGATPADSPESAELGSETRCDVEHLQASSLT